METGAAFAAGTVMEDFPEKGTTDIEVCPVISRFSGYFRLLRATAGVEAAARFWLQRSKGKATAEPPWTKVDGKLSSVITTADVTNAEKRLLRIAQSETNVLAEAKKNRKFDLVVDADGIIRVQGRLDRATCVSEDARNPILLPVKHRLVDLIVEDQHRKNAHVGRNTVFNLLRERFWLLGGRNSVRKAWTNCLACRMARAKPVLPLMGMLPKERVDGHHPPFTHTGCDLFGPIEVTVGRRHEKRWGMLLTCMGTRGIHIEVLSGLSADETLMGLSRFVDSRGVPSHMYSDNGTNFQAAAKILQQRQKFNTIKWHFTPPASPHMGGAWETMVKQVKKALQEILKERFPKDQCLLTAMKAVEKIVNSRPLAFVSNDADDPPSLTPGHFLRGIGIASGMLNGVAATAGSESLGDPSCIDERWAKQWERAQLMAAHFWTRWSKEVLPNLLQRSKWTVQKEPIEVGELVIMVDELKPRRHWTKALVSSLFPGKDGTVRVVEVIVRKFGNSEPSVYRRAVAKLCRTGIRCGDLNTVMVSKSGGRNGKKH